MNAFFLGRTQSNFDPLNTNAYESPKSTDPPRRTRSTRWAIWAGLVCLAMAAICVVMTVVLMVFSFQVISQSTGEPKAEDLATGIGNALIPAYGSIPLALLGIILVIIGFVVRRPIEE